MRICNCCERENNNLQVCESCGEEYCEECLVPYDQYRMIDFCYCRLCDEKSELANYIYD